MSPILDRIDRFLAAWGELRVKKADQPEWSFLEEIRVSDDLKFSILLFYYSYI